MALDSEPTHTPKTEADDSPTEMFEWVERFRQFKKFKRTRDAVLAREPLYDYRKREREDQGYLGAWHFNLVQSTISGFPALIIPFLARLLFSSHVAREEGAVLDELLKSFALPFSLMLTAYVVGRASLWKKDADKAARIRAGKIFLYLDGAYGLYPQMAASAALSIFFLDPESAFRGVINWIGIWQLIVYMKTIPNQLFWALGYTDSAETGSLRLFSDQERASNTVVPRSDPPKWKYRICILIVLPIMALATLIVVYILSAALNPIVRFLTRA